MFRGLYEHSIDAKGRTSLPVRFREVLERLDAEANPGTATTEPRLIITTGIDRCLVAYPVSAWLAFEEKLAGLSQFDPAVVQLKRIYVAGATECTVDRHGRLQLPPMLREYAGLNRDLVWAGMVTTAEIWAKETWTEQSLASRTNRDAILRPLTELGL